MNYYYDYFAKEYRSRQTRGSLWTSPAAMLGNIPGNDVKDCRTTLKNAFEGYRCGRNIEVLKRLLGEYRNYVSEYGDENARNKYNAFVYRYMSGTCVGAGAIAGKLGVSRETVLNYINSCINDLLVICMGTTAYNHKADNQEAAVSFVISNYALLSKEADTYIFDIFRKKSDRAAVEKGRHYTQKILHQLTEATKAYTEYCRDGQVNIDTDIRKADVLELCLAGCSVRHIAEKCGTSEETIYKDIKDNEQRLAALLFEQKGVDTDGKGSGQR